MGRIHLVLSLEKIEFREESSIYVFFSHRYMYNIKKIQSQVRGAVGDRFVPTLHADKNYKFWFFVTRMGKLCHFHGNFMAKMRVCRRQMMKSERRNSGVLRTPVVTG